MTKGCYTCRRRRIICDNGLPTCRKCRDAGKECLGYQKPLVWVKGGVASRGKMMGRSFDDVEKSSNKPRRQEASAALDSTAASNGFGFFSIAEPSSDAESHSSGNQPSPETDNWAFETETPATRGDFAPLSFDPAEEQDAAIVHVPRGSSHLPLIDYTPTPWGLVDPLLKDLSQFSRYYIHHCKFHWFTSCIICGFADKCW